MAGENFHPEATKTGDIDGSDMNCLVVQ